MSDYTTRRTPSLLNNPTHWRLRAQEAWRLADIIDDPVARAATIAIADEYERLAQRAAGREWKER